MDKSENKSKPRYINEYRKIGEQSRYKFRKGKNIWDKLLLQIFMSLIILSVTLFINSINIGIARAMSNGIKNTLNWQVDFSMIEKVFVKSKEQDRKIDEIDEIIARDEGYEKAHSEDEVQALIMPIEGSITSPFGERIHPVFNTRKMHYGIDIDASYGDSIKSSIDGYVVELGEDITLGKYVKIKNEDYDTLYSHCSKIIVKEGQKIKQNEKIAEVGDTGLASGAHLHFEVWVDGEPVDPVIYLK